MDTTCRHPIYNLLETSSTIRLLAINEEDGNWSYSLSHHDLNSDSKIYYSAMSYSWNTEQGDSTLIVNGIKFDVPRNVESLLHRFYNMTGMKKVMQNTEPGSHPLYVWIDLICIDQSDDTISKQERYAQLKMMDRIYSSAILVVADLGSEGFADALTMTLLAKQEPFQWEEDRRQILDVTGGTLELTIQSVAMALENLLLRRYFTRSWILQEFVLNPTLAFLIGNYSFEADAICRNAILASSTVFEPGREPVMFTNERNLSKNFRNLAFMAQLRWFRWTRRGLNFPKLRFSEIVKQACKLNAAYLHDKIYGCLALADQTFRNDFTVDYDEPLETLGRRIVRALIEYERSVSILYQAKCLSGGAEQCSWSLEFSPQRLGTTFSDRSFAGITGKDFDASAGTNQRSPTAQTFDPAILVVQGYIIDTVKATTKATNLDLDDERFAYSRIQEFYHLLPADIRETTSCINAFWRTIIQDHIYPNDLDGSLSRALPHHAVYYLCYLNVMQQRMAELYSDSLRNSVHLFAGIFQRSAEPGLVEGQLSLTMMKRLANTPKGSKSGDIIVVLRGGDFPFVLRPYRSGFQLLGRAYVHGIMDGKTMAEGYEEREFELV